MIFKVLLCLTVLMPAIACRKKLPGSRASSASSGSEVVSSTISVAEIGKYVTLKPSIVVEKGQSYLFKLTNNVSDGKAHLFRFSFALDHFVAKGGDTSGKITVQVLDPKMQSQTFEIPYQYEEDAFKFMYFAPLPTGESFNFKVYDIGDQLAGETIFVGASAIDPQPNLSGESSDFFIETHQGPAEAYLDTTALAPRRIKGNLRAAEAISLNLAARVNKFGFNLGTTGETSCAPAIQATYESGSESRDVSKLMTCDADGTRRFRLDFLYDPAAPGRIKFQFPSTADAFTSGSVSFVPFDGSLSSPEPSDFTDVNLPPTAENPMMREVSGFARWPQSLMAKFLVPVAADGKTHLEFDVAAHVPVSLDAQVPLPDYEKIAKGFAMVALLEGGGTPPTRRNYKDDRGTFQFEVLGQAGNLVSQVMNPEISPGTRIHFTAKSETASIVMEDLPETAMNGLPEGEVSILDVEPIGQERAPFFDPDYYTKDLYEDGGVKKVADLTKPDLPKKVRFTAERFPARAVLLAMEEIRNRAQEKIPVSANPLRGPSNWVDQRTLDDCLGGNEALHWSDISHHYYCQLGNARNCYTNYIKSHASPLGEEVLAIGGGKTGGKLIFTALRTWKFGRLLEIKKELVKIRSAAAKHCKIEARRALQEKGTLEPTSAEAEWLWLTENSRRENMFRFLMEAPTFAFDYDIQQRVLNVFYRVAPDGNFDPNQTDPAECRKRRPTRKIEMNLNLNTFEVTRIANHCATNKVLMTGQTAARR